MIRNCPIRIEKHDNKDDALSGRRVEGNRLGVARQKGMQPAAQVVLYTMQVFSRETKQYQPMKTMFSHATLFSLPTCFGDVLLTSPSSQRSWLKSYT